MTIDAQTIAVVTGAARGVGRGIARVLGQAGATVYVTDRESRNRRFGHYGFTDSTEQAALGEGGRP